MSGSYLGLSYLGWAWIVWGGVFGTFGTIMLYRALISGKRQDELFFPPDEIRRNAAHLRIVNRIATLFGAVSALMLAVNLAVFVFVR
jgi:hypothetical protein